MTGTKKTTEPKNTGIAQTRTINGAVPVASTTRPTGDVNVAQSCDSGMPSCRDATVVPRRFISNGDVPRSSRHERSDLFKMHGNPTRPELQIERRIEQCATEPSNAITALLSYIGRRSTACI